MQPTNAHPIVPGPATVKESMVPVNTATASMKQIETTPRAKPHVSTHVAPTQL